MTEQNMQSLRDDLAYLRALADEGRTAPFLGGSVLIAAGLIFGTASLTHWAVRAGYLTLPPVIFGAIWLVALLAFFACLFLLRGHRNKPGAQALSNRASGLTWAGVGWGIFTIGIGFGIAASRTGAWVIMDLFAPVILSLYGSAWAVSAALTRTRWLWAVAAASYVMALVCAFAVGTVHLWLIYALALYLLAAAPGFILRRREPSDVV